VPGERSLVSIHRVADERDGAGVPGRIVVGFVIQLFNVLVLLPLMQDSEFVRLIWHEADRDRVYRSGTPSATGNASRR